MILLDCEQGSPEWRAARAGVVTASEFKKIITPGTWKPSKQAGDYMNRLVAETLIGRPVDDTFGGSQETERGLAMEGEAVIWYEAERDVKCDIAGFCLRDDRRLGCSPDRLVGTDGGLEIKNPMIWTHVGYLRNPKALVADYFTQVQTSLLVTDRAWWDLESFNPDLPSLVVRCTPDMEWRKAAEPALTAFLASLDAAVAELREAVEANFTPFQ